jgi:hypothetical protein
MAVILNNYANHFGLTLPSIRTGTFNDAAQFSSWAADAINVMYEAGIVSGRGNNILTRRLAAQGRKWQPC